MSGGFNQKYLRQRAPSERVFTFGSLTEWERAGDPENGNDTYIDERRDHMGKQPADWLGIPGEADGAQLLAVVRAGWPEGAQAVGGIAASLEVPPPVSIRRVRRRAEFGAEVDITEYWRGRGDQAWTKCTRQNRAGAQSVRLVASMQGLANASPVAFKYRGAAMLALADALNGAGYNVEIACEYRGGDYDLGMPDTAHRVTVKPATAPLDVAALASCISLIGYKRIVGFTAMCATGRSIGGFASMPAYLGENEFGGIENKIHERVSDPTTAANLAREWVAETLAEISASRSADNIDRQAA